VGETGSGWGKELWLTNKGSAIAKTTNMMAAAINMRKVTAP